MHRDISVGNCMKLITPSERKPFTIENAIRLTTELRKATQREYKSVISPQSRDPVDVKIMELLRIAQQSPNAKDRLDVYHKAALETLKVAKEVEDLVRQLVPDGTCKAVVSDGDLAAYMPAYFVTEHNDGIISV